MVELVTRKNEGGCATLTLNRPERLNALNVALFLELESHIDAIAAVTDKVGLVILRGSGKCFSAGHDLNDIASGEKPPRPNYQAHVIEKLAMLPQPVIAAVHGHCYTGALELALAGDLIMCSENAKFADTHARWALVPVWGMSQRLPRRIGQSKAAEMMLTCRIYTGQQALAMGLVNTCVADAGFDAELAALASTILANSWHSHRANKALLADTDGLPLPAGLSHEIARSRGRGPDMAERIAAFQSKSAKIS
ncbi:enoyl-CoA hydratase/isomerase family protein [Tardiphaga sp. 367_B4_N1_1]|uniref:enoyl-CoA hydratase/isomerase family protein n=1 Tax=Tardiphaga sp. 367_B4_N1_1 TaxID=3240777 RepID=UPI003F1ECFD4